jgi:multidrug resistance protein MdtO
MATAAVRIPHANRFTVWFPGFLRKELAPYPGRGAIVTRTVIAATITMILIVTFRIPGGAIGALFAFTLSRENLGSTARSAFSLVVAFAIGGLFIPVGARMFASEPITHFLWEAASLFLIFFLLRTLTDYSVAVGLTLITTNILSIWYLPGPVERNIELTLWQIAAAVTGALVTFTVEAVFHAVYPRNELIEGLDSRLRLVQERMELYSAGVAPDAGIENMLAQFATVGVGGLRRHLARTNYESLYRTRMSTLVSLTGRSIDFAAALSGSLAVALAEMRTRTERLAQQIADIRHCLNTRGEPCESEFEPEPDAARPLMFELESMVSLMPAVFSNKAAVDPRLELLETATSSNHLFIEDALTNPEHLRFVLSGTLAAMLCYVLYVSLAWPGISTSVTTCVLTALTNVGSSRQKQVLRIAGAALGGFVFGLGAQIFVLPWIDSISGFAVLFAAVTAIAAWIGTSSSRLSYAGVQMALAFYLIHLSEFSIQTSLSVARDRAIGVLVGTSMMWMVFERFYPRSAGDVMIRVFVRNLHLMAELTSDTPAHANSEAIFKVRQQREQIYRNFGEVNAQSDAVPFETGDRRAGDMAARDRIRRWQASLRTFYLLELPLLQFRVFGAEPDRSESFALIEEDFRHKCGEALLHMAEDIEMQLKTRRHVVHSEPSLRQLLARLQDDHSVGISERERALLEMSRRIASLLDNLSEEIGGEQLYETADVPGIFTER